MMMPVRNVMLQSTQITKHHRHAKIATLESILRQEHRHVLSAQKVSTVVLMMTPVRNVMLQSTQIKKHRRHAKIATLENILEQEHHHVLSARKVSTVDPVTKLA